MLKGWDIVYLNLFCYLCNDNNINLIYYKLWASKNKDLRPFSIVSIFSHSLNNNDGLESLKTTLISPKTLIEIIRLEEFCLNEINAKNKNTFFYQLHKNSFFDVEAFNELILNTKKLIELYSTYGITNNYKAILKQLRDNFFYVTFLFYCHLDPNDLFVIKNYADIENNITLYFDDMRDILNNMEL